jgi:hypothetical protein
VHHGGSARSYAWKLPPQKEAALEEKFEMRMGLSSTTIAFTQKQQASARADTSNTYHGHRQRTRYCNGLEHLMRTYPAFTAHSLVRDAIDLRDLAAPDSRNLTKRPHSTT